MDDATVEELYRRYGPSVLRRARSLLRDEHAARDVLQEVFMLVVRERGRFRGASSPMTWIYRVTTNVCLNRIRDQRRRTQLLETRAAPRESYGPAMDDQLTLVALLEKVPRQLAEIAVYHHVDGMSHAEIAEVMGVSRRTVGNRLESFRAQALAETEKGGTP